MQTLACSTVTLNGSLQTTSGGRHLTTEGGLKKPSKNWNWVTPLLFIDRAYNPCILQVPQTSKKNGIRTLVIVACSLALVCVLGLGLLVVGGVSAARGTQVACDFGRKAFVDIGHGWDINVVHQYGTSELGDDKALSGYLALFKNSLGSIKSLGPWNGFHDSSFMGSSGSVQTVEMSGVGTFEKGDATVDLVVRNRGGKWGLAGIHIDSPEVRKAMSNALSHSAGK